MAAGDVAVTLNNPLAKSGVFFDGVDDGLQGGAVTDLAITGDLSVSAFFKSNGNSGTTEYIFSKYGYSLFVSNAAQKITYEGRNAANTAWETIIATNAINYGQWYHVCIVHSSADQLMYLYIDGVLDKTLAKTDGSHGALSTYKPRIGNYAVTANQEFYGVIQKVGVYNVALTAAEVAKLAAGENVERGLLSYTPLKDDLLDTKNRVTWTATGTYFTTQDGILDRDLRTKRTTANDKYFLFSQRGKVFSTCITES